GRYSVGQLPIRDLRLHSHPGGTCVRVRPETRTRIRAGGWPPVRPRLARHVARRPFVQEVVMNLREPDFEPIPGYRLIEPLGSGGFGEVWKCEAPGGLFKAIKFVYGNLNSLDVEGARAEQERTALTRVKEVRHPFVLSLER